MPEEFDGLSDQAHNDSSDWVLSHWFLTEKSSHTGAGKKTKPNEDVI